jgi:hypothetical protein
MIQSVVCVCVCVVDIRLEITSRKLVLLSWSQASRSTRWFFFCRHACCSLQISWLRSDFRLPSSKAVAEDCIARSLLPNAHSASYLARFFVSEATRKPNEKCAGLGDLPHDRGKSYAESARQNINGKRGTTMGIVVPLVFALNFTASLSLLGIIQTTS